MRVTKRISDAEDCRLEGFPCSQAESIPQRQSVQIVGQPLAVIYKRGHCETVNCTYCISRERL